MRYFNALRFTGFIAALILGLGLHQTFADFDTSGTNNMPFSIEGSEQMRLTTTGLQIGTNAAAPVIKMNQDGSVSATTETINGDLNVTGTTQINGNMSVSGGTQIGWNGNACTAELQGMLRWNSGLSPAGFEYCDGSSWKGFSVKASTAVIGVGNNTCNGALCRYPSSSTDAYLCQSQGYYAAIGDTGIPSRGCNGCTYWQYIGTYPNGGWGGRDGPGCNSCGNITSVTCLQLTY